MMIGKEDFIKRKERHKRVRVVIQIFILATLLVVLMMALFNMKTYAPYTKQTANFAGDKGFIALSYFGVDRVGDPTLIGVDRLTAHLQALKAQGYVTITQQDILDYYLADKKLPEKSLFLMFEDGRRDTAIFTEKILEDLNFKATALTYTEKFMLKDTKFLSPDDLQDLRETTYWEMGANGHRLAFINVFDRYAHYLGELTPLKYAMLAPYLDRDYNHYLMDYIRDENRIPKESYLQMKERVGFDYQQMEEIYGQVLGATPNLHVLMHSNTGAFGNDPQVSAINARWIKQLFKINFNREGYAHNNKESSLYDLTRMQPQAYWPTNHLLMRIKYDTDQDISFIDGDVERYRQWIVREGAAEFQGQSIFLTSLPKGKGLLSLKGHDDVADLKLAVRLKGNILGKQGVYLRADTALTRYISVAVVNDTLVVVQKNGADLQELFTLNLQQFDGVQPLSVEEDRKAAEARTLETFGRYADNAAQAQRYLAQFREKQAQSASTVQDGATAYIPAIGPHRKGNRQLEVELQGEKMRIRIDGKTAVESLAVDEGTGGLFLEAAWGGFGWSQRNLADDVYDGVFEELIVSQDKGGGAEVIVYDSRYRGWTRFWFEIKKTWNMVIDWFIVHL